MKVIPACLTLTHILLVLPVSVSAYALSIGTYTSEQKILMLLVSAISSIILVALNINLTNLYKKLGGKVNQLNSLSLWLNFAAHLSSVGFVFGARPTFDVVLSVSSWTFVALVGGCVGSHVMLIESAKNKAF